MAKKKKPPREIYSGEMVSSLDRPNILVPLEPSDDISDAFFPLLQIQLADNEAEHGEEQGLFFDPMHGPNWWQWADRAPTWMDPNKFVEMTKKHPKLMGCLDYCFNKNTERPAERDMPEMLDEVMEEYLEYMLEQFEQAKPYLIAWLVRNYCYKETDPAKTAQRKKRKKRKKRVSRTAE